MKKSSKRAIRKASRAVGVAAAVVLAEALGNVAGSFLDRGTRSLLKKRRAKKHKKR